MAGVHSAAATSMREWKWSPAGNTTARRVFDRALRRELDAVLREAKERVARIREASDLWELERCLGEQSRRIDRNFDYRYSVPPTVFANLLRSGKNHRR